MKETPRRLKAELQLLVSAARKLRLDSKYKDSQDAQEEVEQPNKTAKKIKEPRLSPRKTWSRLASSIAFPRKAIAHAKQREFSVVLLLTLTKPLQPHSIGENGQLTNDYARLVGTHEKHVKQSCVPFSLSL